MPSDGWAPLPHPRLLPPESAAKYVWAICPIWYRLYSAIWWYIFFNRVPEEQYFTIDQVEPPRQRPSWWRGVHGLRIHYKIRDTEDG